MLTSGLSAEKVEIICSLDVLFAEYSFAIEQGIDWFFGRGVSALKARRYKRNVPHTSIVLQVVEITPLMTVRPMTFSLVTSLGTMAKEGFFPKDIPSEDIWKIPGQRHEVRDGHHRVVRANNEMTLLQSYDLDPNMTIGLLAYGLADFITGFFWQGATWVKFQGSLRVVQHQFDKGFEKDELISYLTDPGPGYSVHQKISTLP